MAIVSLRVTLLASYVASDELRLMMGSAPGVSLAGSEPAGGVQLVAQDVGDAAGTTDVVTLTADVTAGVDYESCGVYALGVAVADAAGNVSLAWETFGRIADRPQGVVLQQPVATGSTNEAGLVWAGGFDG